jgi:histidinol-phosphate aminotransferase
MDRVEVVPSGANFLLFRIDGDAHDVWKRLLTHDVLVRDFSSWPRVEGCLRVTVGTPAENDAFLSALSEELQ